MDALIILLRIAHVLFATFWVGTTLFSVLFLQPTIAAMGADGGKFMQRLLGDTRFSLAMTAAGLTTVITGLLMYGPVTGNAVEIMIGPRLPLTIGAIAGIVSAVIGGAMVGRSSGKLEKLSAEMVAQKSRPTREQLTQIQSLQSTIRRGTIWTAVFMVIAVVGMTW
ncbi:MAG: hypothetical protein HC802_21625 [Caldilineaceae bacterium]|nr:hypothetical protein [Caldilineaceae bacterium]